MSTNSNPAQSASAGQPEPSRPLRVGVIGLGFAGQAALKGFLALPDVDVIALAGLEADRLAELGKEHSIPHLYARWQDLLERDDLDAVSVATPTHLHAPIAIAALEGGRHVLSEKPLARSGEEAQAIVDAAVKANRVLKVCFNHRERGDVAILKRHLDAGQLGRVYYAKAHWMRRNGIPGMGSWFTNREMAGGGPLIDLGVHMLDMALYLLGEPRVLSASASTFSELGPRGLGGSEYSAKQTVGSAYEVEDLATAFLRLEGGGVLQLETSWATFRKPGDDFGVSLYGTDGGAEIGVENYAAEDTLRIYTDVAGAPAEVRPRVIRGEGHRAVVREFVKVVRGGDWSAYVGRDGLARARIIDACYQSSLEGREIPVIEA
ncbi:Gfo/Idh/MocA family protein [Actinopolymorpha pittospori]|uniref:Dehydrogenase n=1 Tax=Actinopolymorpha pittospori TaxID=648752 RepID=A0A927N3T4_9ACTN|nr:Gfo/Idh/MocA family oxidoreductase [Actinopolymorpha pittospori]MBE1611564.1 putative dehydrogenase [Actinopolymorpha pittospori]